MKRIFSHRVVAIVWLRYISVPPGGGWTLKHALLGANYSQATRDPPLPPKLLTSWFYYSVINISAVTSRKGLFKLGYLMFLIVSVYTHYTHTHTYICGRRYSAVALGTNDGLLVANSLVIRMAGEGSLIQNCTPSN